MRLARLAGLCGSAVGGVIKGAASLRETPHYRHQGRVKLDRNRRISPVAETSN